MQTRNKAGNKFDQGPSQVRIIGGQWRSRKLSFPVLDGLRPTPDRVRETLFNWLQSTIPGARCLDLFSGSGALGFEALSRGADHCTFIDIAPASCQALRDNLKKLECDSAEVLQRDAMQWLRQLPDAVEGTNTLQFDVIFIDPPFNKDLCEQICQLMVEKKIISERGFIYIETERRAPRVNHWPLHREKTSGQVQYRLYQQD
ncbi:MAG: 16S rRNA (guanine(966)-N(2))-methyltransferase RsmD [Oceanospirillaceae bacterium]|nr:16S rRNA (guanine(966)-N(2))-methyltransferase RsmD [Oceanospirillaceae bacterium]